MRLDHFFLLSLLFFLLIHGIFWRTVSFLDESLWIARLEHLVSDLRVPHSDINQSQYAIHPGMAVVFIAASAHALGLSSASSLAGAVTLFTALATSSTLVACKAARPHTLWWLGGGMLIGLSPLYFHATPTNAVVAPLWSLLGVLALLLYERKHEQHFGLCVAFGLGLGLALATRMAETVLLGMFFLVFLHRALMIKKITLTAAIAGLTAALLDPLLLFTPLDHLRYVFGNSTEHFVHLGVGSILEYDRLLFQESLTISAGLAVASAVLAYIFVVLHRLLRTLPIHWHFLLFMLLLTIFFVTFYSGATSRSLRYFYPLILLWQVFLPMLWVGFVNLVSIIPLPFFQRYGRRIVIASRTTFVALIVCQLSITLYIFFEQYVL